MKKCSVILSTYNSPEWLQKVLWGYEKQTEKSFEIVIADDGSKDPTRKMIDQFKDRGTLDIKHVWHEDNGFRKTRILNKGIIKSTTDYLIFSDGDCIPKSDFVETHINHRKMEHFLSGGYFKLPMSTSEKITKTDIENGSCFSLSWLRRNGLGLSPKNLKLVDSFGFRKLLNLITSTKPSWNGHNASGWKKDIMRAGGFDERMEYGGEDRELGERLVNAGVEPIQIRYFAICIHLDHARGYIRKEALQLNEEIRRETRKTKKLKTEHGI